MCSTLCHAKLCMACGPWPLFYRQVSCDLNRQMHNLPFLMSGPKSPKYSNEELRTDTNIVPTRCPKGEPKVGIAFCKLHSPGMEKVLRFPGRVSLGCGDSLATLSPSRRVTVQRNMCISYDLHVFTCDMQICS